MGKEIILPKVEPRYQKLRPKAWAIWDGKVKPQLSLGILEHLVVDLVEMTGRLDLDLGRPQLLLFAADHGIVEEGVSSSPQEITWQQCENFVQGGGAIGLLCAMEEMDLHVVDVGVAHDFGSNSAIIGRKIAWGTNNFLNKPAMDHLQLQQALTTGVELVGDLFTTGHRIFAFGEMGIGNTSSASAIMAAYTGLPLDTCVGRGAGIDQGGLHHKRTVIGKALDHHGKQSDPLEILRIFGGFEIAAMVGGMLAAAHGHSVILVDGFIATVAATIAIAVEPHAKQYMVFCHESNEGGHPHLLAFLDVKPLFSLKMCLGEGTGAAVAWPIIRQALQLFIHMNSFSSAHVTDSVSLLKERGVDLHENEV
jgi:nicotinate-nucleotide--dimethylbenzimidazole phosphoribosyltransferase